MHRSIVMMMALAAVVIVAMTSGVQADLPIHCLNAQVRASTTQARSSSEEETRMTLTPALCFALLSRLPVNGSSL